MLLLWGRCLAGWTWRRCTLDHTCGLVSVLLNWWRCHFFALGRHLAQALLTIDRIHLLLSVLRLIPVDGWDGGCVAARLLGLLWLLEGGSRFLWLAESGNARLKLYFRQRRLASRLRYFLFICWIDWWLILASHIVWFVFSGASARRSTTARRHILQRFPYLWIGLYQLLILLIYLIQIGRFLTLSLLIQRFILLHFIILGRVVLHLFLYHLIGDICRHLARFHLQIGNVSCMSNWLLWLSFRWTLLLIFNKWLIQFVTSLPRRADLTTRAIRVQRHLQRDFHFLFCLRRRRVLRVFVVLKFWCRMLHLGKRMHLSPVVLIRVPRNLHSLILSATCRGGETVLGSDGRVFGGSG